MRPAARSAWPLSACLAFAVVLTAVLLPHYPGSPGALATFALAASAFAVAALWLRPSFFLCLVACFLSLGFPAKLIVLLAFATPLIEPVGEFDGSADQWDWALGLSSAGLFGGLAAILAASRIPVRLAAPASAGQGRRYRRALLGALVLLLTAAAAVYGLNAELAILRIGYPPGLLLPFPLMSLLSFTIAWGALLAGLTLGWLLVERGEADRSLLLYVAIALGLGAAITMGSRAQFLLYFGAALLAVANVPGRSWLRQLVAPRVIAAGLVGVLAFGGSLALVSLERSYSFSAPQEPLADRREVPPDGGSKAAGGRDGDEAGSDEAGQAAAGRSGAERGRSVGRRPPGADPAPLEQRVPFIVGEIQNLVILRWVGLEGVLTLAGAQRELGADLLLQGLAEDPATGMEGLYQKLAGEPYQGVTYFTFLTLPGPIGVAGYSGSLPLTAALVGGLLLVGHLIELSGSLLLRNVGANAAVGVSLAYLTVQLCFPWTLLAYAVQLAGALLALAALDRALKALPLAAGREPA